jgi:hypothetical protein
MYQYQTDIKKNLDTRPTLEYTYLFSILQPKTNLRTRKYLSNFLLKQRKQIHSKAKLSGEDEECEIGTKIQGIIIPSSAL